MTLRKSVGGRLCVFERQLGQALRVIPLAQPPHAELDQQVGRVQHAQVGPRQRDVGVQQGQQVRQLGPAQRRAGDDRPKGVAHERDSPQRLADGLGTDEPRDLAREVLAQPLKRASGGELLVGGGHQVARAVLVGQQQRHLVPEAAQVDTAGGRAALDGWHPRQAEPGQRIRSGRGARGRRGRDAPPPGLQLQGLGALPAGGPGRLPPAPVAGHVAAWLRAQRPLLGWHIVLDRVPLLHHHALAVGLCRRRHHRYGQRRQAAVVCGGAQSPCDGRRLELGRTVARRVGALLEQPGLAEVRLAEPLGAHREEVVGEVADKLARPGGHGRQVGLPHAPHLESGEMGVAEGGMSVPHAPQLESGEGEGGGGWGESRHTSRTGVWEGGWGGDELAGVTCASSSAQALGRLQMSRPSCPKLGEGGGRQLRRPKNNTRPADPRAGATPTPIERHLPGESAEQAQRLAPQHHRVQARNVLVGCCAARRPPRAPQPCDSVTQAQPHQRRNGVGCL
eukprot:scaffold288_cov108-Isochrysis_galbana.AAC.10